MFLKSLKKESLGFTLLEILVVMSIIGSLLFFLISSISAFRRNIVLSQSSEQIMGTITQTTNLAGNNIIPNGFEISEDSNYSYFLDFLEDSIVRKFCAKPTDEWECYDEYDEKLLINYLQKVSLNSDCDGILFSNLSGDIWIKNATGYSTTGECNLEIAHQDNAGDTFRKIIFNGNKNSYEIVFPD